MPLEVKVFYLFSLFPEVYFLKVSLKSQLLKSIKSRMQENGARIICVNVSSLTLATFGPEGLDCLCHFSQKI